MSVVRGRRRLALVAALAFACAGASPAAAAEALVQQVAADPFTNSTSQHATAVEPDSFAWGDTVVAAFQLGRFTDGGASGIGFATSVDGGRTWTAGTLPGLTDLQTPVGTFDRATDPSVAYDAVHGVWVVSTLLLREPCAPGGCPSSIVVSRSTDGVVWSGPVTVTPYTSPIAYDKNWTTCDNGAASPRRGRCYTSFSHFGDGRKIATARSDDGGVTWSGWTVSADPAAVGLGAQPVVRPDGSLVVLYLADTGQIAAIRSTDGGLSFGSQISVATVSRHAPTLLRGRALPSAEADRDGVVYAAWDDCRFRAACGANDVVVTRSADGLAWEPPARVPVDELTSGAEHVLPGLAVDATTGGAEARLALTFYTVGTAACAFEDCALRPRMISSLTSGATWQQPVELGGGPMALAWIPDTTQGRMLGDYVGTSFVSGGAAVGVFPAARAAASGFDQPLFAARLIVAPPPPPPPPPPASPPPSPPASAPPPAASLPVAPPAISRRLAILFARAVPARPVAGRTFSVRFAVQLLPGDTASGAAVSCTARVRGRSVPLRRRSVAGGVARCTWVVPRRSAGNLLRLTIRATSAGAVPARAAPAFRIERPRSPRA
jgi:hypothetical protein